MGESSARRQIVIGHGNTWHDPAFAIADGDRLFAEAVERHAQCKRGLEMTRPWYSWRDLQRFLAAGGWPVEQADAVILSTWTRPSVRSVEQVLERPASHPFVALLAGSTLLEPVTTHQLGWLLHGQRPRPFAPPRAAAPGVPPPRDTTYRARTINHQLAHAANAVFTSPFEECVVMIVDGFGEGTALSFYHWTGAELVPLETTRPGVSLGFLYALVTQFCGFDPYAGEEWKVMGLAPYGALRDELHAFFRDRIVVEGLRVDFRPSPGAFGTAAWRELEELAGGFRAPGDPDVERAADLACSFQQAFEEVLFELARNARALGLSENLAVAGGCALNSSANGKLLAESGFAALHVPCAPADDGNALGAVLYERHVLRREPRPAGPLTPYLGSPIDDEELDRALRLGRHPHRRFDDFGQLAAVVAEKIAAGRIVGWIQGRAEFGPRALGNRSILADPRDAAMKDRINARVKFRESYRPFAPSILHGCEADWFEDPQPAFYMERTLRFREEMAARVPAVVHVNGTGRLQSVREDWNPRYWALISAFRELTGVPIVLNTSFNVMGKPIAHSAADVLTVHLTTGIDDLVVGDVLLEKP